jgi:hypothetical protein
VLGKSVFVRVLRAGTHTGVVPRIWILAFVGGLGAGIGFWGVWGTCATPRARRIITDAACAWHVRCAKYRTSAWCVWRLGGPGTVSFTVAQKDDPVTIEVDGVRSLSVYRPLAPKARKADQVGCALVICTRWRCSRVAHVVMPAGVCEEVGELAEGRGGGGAGLGCGLGPALEEGVHAAL